MDISKILEAIYGNGISDKDCADVIRQIRTRLDDCFYENPPSQDQKRVLDILLIVADQVEEFFK